MSVHYAEEEYLQADVEVEEAHGSFVSQLILFLHSSHLHDAQTLGLRRQSLHAQRLQTVLWSRGQRSGQPVLLTEGDENKHLSFSHTSTSPEMTRLSGSRSVRS